MADPAQQQLLEQALLNCAREPIHLIGSIQPVGVLLAVDARSLVIRAASENLESLFEISVACAVGQPLGALIGGEHLAWLATLADAPSDAGPRICSLKLTHGGQPRQHDALVYRSDDLLVIEVEHGPAPAGDVLHNLFVPFREVLSNLDCEASLGRYAQATVSQVRQLSGFDRVMMYRFDSNWDGEVIAESRIDEAQSYLGNRFPASDIPAQARALYTRNLVRLIADVDAPPVPLLGDNGAAPAQPIDLSHSWLRNLSPVHVEYLRNMGVGASLSISLVQNGRLWGLIACHHFTPKYVSLRARELSEFIGRTASLKLSNMDREELDALNRRIRDLLQEMTGLIRCSEDLDTVIHLLKDKLLGLVRAEGAIFVMDGKRHLLGSMPPAAAVDSLLRMMRQRPGAPVFHTDNLSQFSHDMHADTCPPGEALSGGVLVAPLDRHTENFIMWFRPGILRTLRWAGRPQKALRIEGDCVRLSPRQSFDTWVETYQDNSLPWSPAEIEAASALSLALIEVMTRKALETSEQSYRLLAENSTDMIARLNLAGHFQFASPACQKLLGRDSQQLIGLHMAEVLEDRTGGEPGMLASLRAPGDSVTRVVRGLRPDGRTLWVEVSIRHTLGSRGEDEILLNARDITQRYNYQLAIEDVHRRNTQILEAAGEALVSFDHNGRVTYANDLATRLLANDEGQVIGEHFCELFCCSSMHRDDAACPFLATLRDGETRQGKRYLSGEPAQPLLLMEYICTPLLDNQSIAGCVVLFSQSAHNPLLEQNAEVMLDQALEAVMITDPYGRITSVNRAFSEITGFAAEEILGNTPKAFKSGVHTPNFYDDLWHALKTNRRWSGELWNRRKNGEIYPQWGSISAILDGAGEVRNYVALFTDISKAKQAEEKLYHLANHDALTGLPNRLKFADVLARSIERSKHGRLGAAVVFIDLDRFKIINDTLGHAVGDSYLKIIAERLLSATRKQDTLARWGGDEFILAMENVSDQQLIRMVMARILKAVSEPIYLAGHELIPTASIGVSLYPGDGNQPADLIKAADIAMYRAKERRDSFEFFDSTMTAALDSKLIITAELRHAIEEQQFSLVYQPQIDPRNGAIRGVEALVRWNHPTRGIQPPDSFLPMIKELGLTRDLGHWVMSQACRQMREWNDQGVPIPRVAVNVAPSELKESFVSAVARIIEHAGIPAGQLELEITEGALESSEQARKITTDLRQLGVLLSIDDFGTGYSSLSHLKLFPITCFKIDRSFIRGVPANEDDIAIVRTILALGAIFKVEVVAEGAETAEQVEFLHAEGVTSIQGYFFAQPMPAQQLEQWIAERQKLEA